jgi:phosphoribosylformylglycinamidine synthase
MALSKLHAVESTVIGRYTDTGKLHITYEGKTCAFVDLDLLESGFPQWEFKAEWRDPQDRGLREPVMNAPRDYGRLLRDLLARPNVCAKNWVARQYDHEVQGGSVLKPLVGEGRDVPGDAAVVRPVLTSNRGIAFSQALLPFYSAIDAYHMTTCTIDEAVRRLIAVGGDPSHIGGVDNFCWPSIQYDPETNPDGKFKAAQLVRSCRALKDMCMAYEIPLLSGKDSMYVDGHLTGRYGESHKVSALETLQFSATSLVPDVERCVSMDLKVSGDFVYVLGLTRDELGASEYYEHVGYIGARVPRVDTEPSKKLYHALFRAISKGLVASAHGIYRGGLGVHLAMTAMGGGLGLDVDLAALPSDGANRDDVLLFSESAGRFIVSIAPKNRDPFESILAGVPFGKIGTVGDAGGRLTIRGKTAEETGGPLVDLPVPVLKEAWMAPLGELI